MHEVSLISEVIAIVSQAAAERELESIHKVKLVVGEHTAAMPDSLQFAFELLKDKPLADTAVLEIERGQGEEFFIEYMEGE
ncbi:hydrogenase maturation nickel metallochaperone HypA [Paenibacillus thalictri]|uniref:Hydrogenase maturation nickel metallochaperone HypA n=1 Tax=Paenibacillus thalictri TaxID=2527873 RepID=A0A4Q9DWU3_9BACL|nr:hydrogenase maturation nickel metallochaperone HypA [Paenibacillus thalictri]TBL80302.1 hydrogenase maturation nickel metallochaperone HypA [Paenibacillus thalictri]